MNKLEKIETDSPAPKERPPGPLPEKPKFGLSFKLLILTVIFVLIAEILIFVPSIANFRNVWLKNHLETAEAASIVYLDVPEFMLSAQAGNQILDATQSSRVVIRQGDMSRLMAAGETPTELVAHIDLDNTSPIGAVTSALSVFAWPDDSQYRVFAKMRSSDAEIELVQEARYLKSAMWSYARNIAILSILISIITAGLVYLALYRMIVRPIIKISSNMDAFSREPENASLIYRPGKRSDEIGLAEHRLSAFQGDLRNTLRQKQRLADLGLAVSKINHDLRNILASAQLFSDRLTSLPDPTVQRFAPKLIRTIDRAIDYTKSVIDYGKALEAPPNQRQLLLFDLVNDVGELLGLQGHLTIEWKNEIKSDFRAYADPEQLFRVLMNLCRNAVQALEETEGADKCALTVSANHTRSLIEIRVSDSGPGIPDHVAEKIFNAFQGSTRAGGTGLGMTIAAELIRAHGGNLQIESSNSKGTTILVTLPAGPQFTALE